MATSLHLTISDASLPLLTEGLSDPRIVGELRELYFILRGDALALVNALKPCVAMVQLTELNLWARQGLPPEAIRSLIASWLPGALRSLYLRAPALDDTIADLIATCPGFKRLRRLMLHSEQELTGLTPEAAFAIADAPHLSHLEILTIRGSTIGNRGVLALVTSPHMSRLRRLDVSDGVLTNEGARILAASLGSLEHLEALDVSRNNIDEAGLEELYDLDGIQLLSEGQHIRPTP